MQLIKDIKWALQKAKMRAYLKRKHGGNAKVTAAILALAPLRFTFIAAT